MENLNITKTELGFKFNNIDFEFVEDKQHLLLPENTCHINTKSCIIFFDLSATIEGASFETIEDFIAELYK
jgi:hypothetical protein